MAKTVAGQMGAAMDRTREQLSGAARVAREKAQKLGRRAAGYVRTHNMKRAVAEAGRTVRRYPGQALLAALCAGFLAGRLLRPTH